MDGVGREGWGKVRIQLVLGKAWVYQGSGKSVHCAAKTIAKSSTNY